MYNQVKVAAISLRPVPWDKDHNADRMEALFVTAAREHPRVIVTTEGALEGYVVNDVMEHREKAEAMLAIAEPIDGPYIQRFRSLARSLHTCLCFGFAERIADEVYNCAVFVDDTGEICGKYHKTQFGEGTHPSCYFNRIGKMIRAFDTPVGRAGMVICADRRNPLITHTLVLDGARIVFMPSYGSRKREQNRVVLSRARENGIPIVEANKGMNLIISKGEIVAYRWGNDQITTAIVDIPESPSREAARRSEEEFLQWQGVEMERRYQETMRKLAEKQAARDSARAS